MARKLSFREAIKEAMAGEMRRDPRVIILGEVVRLSLMGQTAGLVKEFGRERVINTPVAENAIAGVAIGAAMNGLRPVLELLLCDFAMLAMDQICNNLAQWRYVTGGQYPLPVTIKTTVGGGFGLGFGHSQCLESMFLQVPGLIVVEPSTPSDAKGLLASALRSDDPVIFFAGTIAVAIDELRATGVAVGAVALCSFRPFPLAALAAVLGQARRVVVVERSLAPGLGGTLASNVRMALRGHVVPVHTVIAGLGGRPVTRASLRPIFVAAATGTLDDLTFLDLDHHAIDRELARWGEHRRSGPSAENILRDARRPR